MIAALVLASALQARVDAGIASAVGFGGIALQAQPAENARVELGGGYGITGWQLSLMPKYAIDAGNHTHYLIGFGPSVSLKKLDPAQYASEFHSTGVGVWLNAEAGLEHVLDSGVVFFVAGGLTGAVYGNYLIARSWTLFDTGKYMSVAGAWSFQGRIGVGRNF